LYGAKTHLDIIGDTLKFRLVKVSVWLILPERRVFRKAALNSGCAGGKDLDLATISMAQAATHLSHSRVWAHNPFAANRCGVPFLSFSGDVCFSKASGRRVLRATPVWA